MAAGAADNTRLTCNNTHTHTYTHTICYNSLSSSSLKCQKNWKSSPLAESSWIEAFNAITHYMEEGPLITSHKESLTLSHSHTHTHTEILDRRKCHQEWFCGVCVCVCVCVCVAEHMFICAARAARSDVTCPSHTGPSPHQHQVHSKVIV